MLIARAERSITSLISIAIVSLLLLGLFTAPCEAGPDGIEEWPVPEFKEPSGIVFHPGRGTLFVCGDEGDVGEISLTGEFLRSSHVGGDLEAITTDPSTGLLYVVREGHEILLELRPDDFKLTRRFNIRRDYQGDAEYLKRGGNGIEGLTFVPDDAHPEGGRFFAVNQDDPAVLIELAVPLKTLEGKFGEAKVIDAHAITVRPSSGLLWLEDSGRFLIPSALWKAAILVDPNGRRLATISIPGLMQEGIARLPDGTFVIAQDVGGLIKWSPESDPLAEPKDSKVAK